MRFIINHQLSLSRFMVHDAFEARRPSHWLVDLPGLQSCPPAFLALTRVIVDELPRLVPPFEAAWPAQKACCDALPYFRMHLTRWPLTV